MHKEMKHKAMIGAFIVVVGVAGFMWVKNRFGGMSIGTQVASGQIMLMNDSSDKISVDYKVGDKMVAKVLAPREEIACGDNGLVRVKTAHKSGSYELTYPVDQRSRKVALSQIVGVAKKDNVAAEILTETGMVGDIKVMYEEVVSDE